MSRATGATRRRVEEAARALPMHDTQDFADADRGFIATREDPLIRADDGRVVWDLDGYAFLAGDAPETVHPSLWRQSRLCAKPAADASRRPALVRCDSRRRRRPPSCC